MTEQEPPDPERTPKPSDPTGSAPLSFKRGRSLRNRRTVQFADRFARSMITIGGLATIFAVIGVAVFLVAVVQRLFDEAAFEEPSTPSGLATMRSGNLPLRLGSDEFGRSHWRLDDDGRLRVVRADTGETYREIDLARGASLTAVGGPHHEPSLVLGFEDGRVRLCDLEFDIRFVEPEDLPPEVVRPGGSETAVVGEGDAIGLVERLPSGRFRKLVLEVSLGEPIEIASAPILDCDRIDLSGAIEVLALSRPGDAVRPVVSRARFDIREDLFSGERTSRVTDIDSLVLESERVRDGTIVRFLDAGRGGIVLDRGGRAGRIRIGGRETSTGLHFVQSLDLRERAELGGSTEVRDVVTLLGGKTLVVGHRSGVVSAWFLINDSSGPDGQRLLRAKVLEVTDAPIECLGTSARGRTVIAGDARGSVHLLQITTEEVLGSRSVAGGAVHSVALGPKADRALVIAEVEEGDELRGYALEVDLGHPEVSIGSIFLPTYYEGRDAPDFAWQTSAASDSYEPKFSLVPLIFGTLKATIYTMLLSVPLALLAAIYTSEFLSKQRRARIKPLVEMMASLPSVVLGFIAAVVLAPFIEDQVAGLVACAVTVPLSILGGAYVWQTFPLRQTLPRQGLKMPLMAVSATFGILLGLGSNDWIEALLFDGDLKLWLSDSTPRLGSAGLAADHLATGSRDHRVADDPRGQPGAPTSGRRRDRTRRGASTSREVGGRVGRFRRRVLRAGRDLLLRRWAVLGRHLGPAGGLRGRRGRPVAGGGLRPTQRAGRRLRHGVRGRSDHLHDRRGRTLQRAGEPARGFARAGASPWQTAIRVVLPTATSGLFSAVMIGLGRAVGETMIVLMAAGNTPILELNVFRGFQTLSAGIATELPEAPAGSTHYRTLFLAALVLFAITFVINSVAEGVRQHFRRKFSQL